MVLMQPSNMHRDYIANRKQPEPEFLEGSIMASEAQVNANRSNAQKSTGPRTAEGKAVVAQNAVKHGLAARLEVIRGEDQAEFDRHRQGMLDELAPVGTREITLAERVVGLSWRLQRAGRLQNEVFDALLGDRSSPLARSLLPEGATGAQEESEAEPELTRGRVVLEDFSNGRVLDRLLLYERRIERSFYSAMRELRDVQRVRGTAPTPAGATAPDGQAGGGPAVRNERSLVSQEIGGEPLQMRDALSAMRSRIADEVDREMPAGSLIAPRGLSWGTDAEAAASVQTMMDELRRTKPISPEAQRGQVAGGQGVAADSRPSACGETKPISARGSRRDSIDPGRRRALVVTP
jgi:hypothetical protein